ncbi:ABC-2 family transporter protein [Paraburkholderia mimosarum]|uniref:ABC-2 family transporter protein n=1 Tax=Paraburkholderia mimosarum TaxID=312026 RepID=UPI000425C362|nr:ABC-2 family transporter protein [Paraburkholderia mimosarum]
MRVLIEKAFARQIHYLGNYVSYITIQAVAQMLTLFYLHTVFTYTDTLNGWTREQAIFVFYLATMVTLTAECFICSIHQYYLRLVRGLLDPVLIMPLRRRTLQLLRWSEPGFLVPVVALLCCWPLIDPQPHRPMEAWIGGLAILAVGVLSIIVVFAVISLTALVTQRLAPADFMVSELSRMVFLPSSVMPGGAWQIVLGIGLPLLFSANAAGAVLIAGDYRVALILTAGTVVLAVLHQVIESRVMRSFSFPGG